MKFLSIALVLSAVLFGGIGRAQAQEIDPRVAALIIGLQEEVRDLKTRVSNLESSSRPGGPQEFSCTSMCGDITSYRYVYGTSTTSLMEAFRDMERSCTTYHSVLFVAYQRNPLSYTLATIPNACVAR